MRRRDSWTDDGRTVADMSGVLRPGEAPAPPRPPAGNPPPPWEDSSLSREARYAAVRGALGAALLIAAVFIGGLGLLIWLLLRLWM